MRHLTVCKISVILSFLKTNWNFTGCQMSHFMIVLIPYITLLNLSWRTKCLFLRNTEPLKECIRLVEFPPQITFCVFFSFALFHTNFRLKRILSGHTALKHRRFNFFSTSCFNVVCPPSLQEKLLLTQGDRILCFQSRPFSDGRHNNLTELPHLKVYLLVLGFNQNFIVDHWFCKTDGPSTNSRLVVNISFSKFSHF